MDHVDGARDKIEVRAARAVDRDWIRRVVEQRWSGPILVSRGRVHQVDRLEAYIAWDGEERVGLVTYRHDASTLEILTLDSLHPGRGIGTALLEAVEGFARQANLRRLFLVTTNDKVESLSFYLRRGLRLVAVHRDALVEARRLKPSIPIVGEHGLRLLDELEFELDLTADVR